MLNNKKVLLLLVIVVFLFIGVGCTGEQEGVAVVNGEELARSDFEQTLQQIKSSYEQQGMDLNTEEGKEVLKQLEQQTLNNMISQELLRQAAEKEGYDVPVDKINDQLEQIKGQFGDEQQFKQALEENQMTENDLKELITTEVKIGQYIENQIGEITVTEEQMKELYSFYSEQDENIPEFEQIKAQIEQQVKSEKIKEETNGIVERLKNDSEIEILY